MRTKASFIGARRAFGFVIVVAAVGLSSVPSAAQQSGAKPPDGVLGDPKDAAAAGKAKNENLLAPPGTPYTVTKADGSTLTTSGWGLNGSKAVTKDNKGNLLSEVYKMPADRYKSPEFGQSTTIKTPDVQITK